MRVLVVDKGGFALDFAMRAAAHGHNVKVFIRQNNMTRFIGRGLVDVIGDWHDYLLWADMIVMADNTLYTLEMDGHRRKKHAPMVIGATTLSASYELDRMKGMEVFRKAGIPIAPYREFSDYDTAIAYVKKEGRPFVSKPSGDEPDKSLSYVASTAADLVYMLERWKKAQKLKGKFILQEKIKGVEMAVGGWMGPGGFLPQFCENWEYKKLMNGDLGINTGEQGSVIRVVDRSKLAHKVLKPIEDVVRASGHIGYWDVNCIIDENGEPWPLEHTARFGYPTWNIQQQLLKGDPVAFLEGVARGRMTKFWEPDTVAVGVVLSIPDYPYSTITRKEVVGVPIMGLRDGDLPSIHPCEIMMGDSWQMVGENVMQVPGWVTAGDYVLVASGKGADVRQAREQAYRILSRLTETPSSVMYRTDIGMKLRHQLQKLQPMGYALNMKYAS